ncbi:hypothetical protein GCM10027296_08100 [Chitinimonas naiadis]
MLCKSIGSRDWDKIGMNVGTPTGAKAGRLGAGWWDDQAPDFAQTPRGGAGRAACGVAPLGRTASPSCGSGALQSIPSSRRRGPDTFAEFP